MSEVMELRNDTNRYMDLHLSQLRDVRKRLGAELKDVQKIVAQIDEAVAAKTSLEIAKGRSYHAKKFGSLSLVIDGVEVKSTIPRNVKWDSGLLEELSNDIEETGANPMEWIEYELKIPETKYNKMPAAVRDIVDKARTIKPGKEKLEFVEAD